MNKLYTTFENCLLNYFFPCSNFDLESFPNARVKAKRKKTEKNRISALSDFRKIGRGLIGDSSSIYSWWNKKWRKIHWTYFEILKFRSGILTLVGCLLLKIFFEWIYDGFILKKKEKGSPIKLRRWGFGHFGLSPNKVSALDNHFSV